MRDIPIDEVDHLDRAVVAIRTDYPPGHRILPHRHRRAQFLYSATGSMRVETADGTWTIPTRRAVLVPPETVHQVFTTNVSTRSLYIEPKAVPWFPRRCQVVEVSALLRELLNEAVGVPELYTSRGRDAAVIGLTLHEIRRSAPVRLDLPLPKHERLRALCESFLDSPDIHDPAGAWAKRLHVSERTLNRLFTAETGMGFARWRQRACVLHSLSLLSDGLPIAAIAASLGYESPAAFSTMFTRLLGTSPRDYRAASAL
ncbi:AraC family transcriptional regulator [Amycolatopsis sp. WAC 04169]|uniref:AraC family transcriptional regulator n=1 Tax=Amycolatopsis sp. WAC 04169 TaxID=2203197 RepID=UPI000F789D6B|nr:helix-turn-helix transcriptional regulator [Amycolatopsis sp. WAC 04169]RSN27072.1 AraC family transcriptional regulator [Amycolatopsis sp. WAC 04169]